MIKFEWGGKAMDQRQRRLYLIHETNVYCDIELEDSRDEIIWDDYNDFSASAISKVDDKVIGSTAQFKESDFSDMKKLSDELGISEKEISEIIKKGNELYKDFYSEQ